MSRKRTVSLLLCLLLVITTGCGELDPSDVNKLYVQRRIVEALESAYGVSFVVNITSFNKNSEKRESISTVYPKNDPELEVTVIGSIEDDYFDDSKIGSSYHIEHDFYEVLWAKVNGELSKNKYSFEIGAGADFDLAAANVRDYLNQLRVLLDDYKNGARFRSYFNEKHQRGRIPLTLNGDDITREIIIDSSNGKVIVDMSQGEHGWQGELEVEEYLQLLANGQLEKKIDEIRIGYGYTPFYGNS